MALSSADRCPHCGAPYMSTLAPGEVDNRVCYSCNTVPTAPNPNAAVDDDLSIQPLEGGSSGQYHSTKGNVRKQIERQIRTSGVHAGVTSKANLPAVRKGNSNVGMPAARISNSSIPVAKPANRSTQAMPAVRSGGSTRLNMQPAQPSAETTTEAAVEPGVEAAPESVDEFAPQPHISTRTAAVRSSARHRAVKSEKSSMPLVIAAAAVLFLGAVGVYAMKSSNAPAPEIPVARIEYKAPPAPAIPPVNAVPAAAPAPEAIPAKPATTVAAKAQPAEAPAVEPAAAVAPETAAVPEKAPEPAAPVVDVSVPKRATNAKLDDEEAMIELEDKKIAKKTAAAKGDAKAEPDKKGDALAGMGITGKKKDAAKQEDVPVFDDIRKPKPVIPVTSTEPTIIKEDLTQGDQNPEKQFSQSIQEHFPGWRVRDIALDQSQSMFTSAEHRGKKDVLILNPMNDVLPAKLYCTVEIPKEYAGKRPMLVFEVSTKDKAADWYLGVKAMNVDIRPKAAIRCPDEAKWLPVGVDLSGLAGKRFELMIEAYMTPKANKKLWPNERAYIRNVQLMWAGKK